MKQVFLLLIVMCSASCRSTSSSLSDEVYNSSGTVRADRSYSNPDIRLSKSPEGIEVEVGYYWKASIVHSNPIQEALNFVDRHENAIKAEILSTEESYNSQKDDLERYRKQFGGTPNAGAEEVALSKTMDRLQNLRSELRSSIPAQRQAVQEFFDVLENKKHLQFPPWGFSVENREMRIQHLGRLGALKAIILSTNPEFKLQLKEQESVTYDENKSSDDYPSHRIEVNFSRGPELKLPRIAFGRAFRKLWNEYETVAIFGTVTNGKETSELALSNSETSLAYRQQYFALTKELRSPYLVIFEEMGNIPSQRAFEINDKLRSSGQFGNFSDYSTKGFEYSFFGEMDWRSLSASLTEIKSSTIPLEKGKFFYAISTNGRYFDDYRKVILVSDKKLPTELSPAEFKSLFPYLKIDFRISDALVLANNQAKKDFEHLERFLHDAK